MNKDEDLVYVPDQPNFNFSPGVTVAGWFNHDAIDQDAHAVPQARRAASSSFALVLNNGSTSSSSRPGTKARQRRSSPKKAKVGEWTHVAATYDGITMRLYVNGILVVANGRRRARIVPGRRTVPDGQRRQQAPDRRRDRQTLSSRPAR